MMAPAFHDQSATFRAEYAELMNLAATIDQLAPMLNGTAQAALSFITSHTLFDEAPATEAGFADPRLRNAAATGNANAGDISTGAASSSGAVTLFRLPVERHD